MNCVPMHWDVMGTPVCNSILPTSTDWQIVVFFLATTFAIPPSVLPQDALYSRVCTQKTRECITTRAHSLPSAFHNLCTPSRMNSQETAMKQLILVNFTSPGRWRLMFFSITMRPVVKAISGRFSVKKHFRSFARPTALSTGGCTQMIRYTPLMPLLITVYAGWRIGMGHI